MYRMIYESGGSGDAPKISRRCRVLTAVLFALFCLAVCTYWPEGKMLLQTLLIPGDPETTLQAAEVFAAEVGSGYALSDAVRNLCSAVFENGYPG